jgi:hypothetical protein
MGIFIRALGHQIKRSHQVLPRPLLGKTPLLWGDRFQLLGLAGDGDDMPRLRMRPQHQVDPPDLSKGMIRWAGFLRAAPQDF